MPNEREYPSEGGGEGKEGRGRRGGERGGVGGEGEGREEAMTVGNNNENKIRRVEN